MKRRALLMSLVVIAASAAALVAQKDAEYQKFLAERSQPQKPFKIIGNLYYVGMNDLASFLIATNRGLILIDTGAEESGPFVRENIKALGFDLSDVRIILSGHAHFDHVGGLQAMREATGAKVYAMAPDALILRSGGTKGFFPFAKYKYPPVTVDKIIRDGQLVRLGGVSLRAHWLPGHTEGNTGWSFKTEEGGRVYDVLIAPSMSVNPGVDLVTNKKWPGVAKAYISSFAKLRSLKCDVCLTSHATSFDLSDKVAAIATGSKTNPFIDPTWLGKYLDALEGSFKKELERQKGELKQRPSRSRKH